MLDKNDIQIISDLLDKKMDEKFDDFAVIVNAGFESQKQWTIELFKSGLDDQKKWTKEFVKEEFHNNNLLIEQQFHDLKLWAEGTFVTRSEFHMRFDKLEQRVDKLEMAMKVLNTDIEEIKKDLAEVKENIEALKQRGHKVEELEERVKIIENQILELKTA